MARFVFADTSGWVAGFVKEDGNHSLASRFLQESLLAQRRFLTTDYVFDETVTRIRYQPPSASRPP